MITTFDFNDGNGLVSAHRHKNPNGEFGGWVANSAIVEVTVHVDIHSLIYGQAWVYDNAQVLGQAQIFGEAQVYNQAQVYGEAQVYNQAQVYGEAKIYGKAKIFDNAHIFGNGQVSGKALVFGNVRVYGNALVFDKAQVSGHARIFGNSRIHGEMQFLGQVNSNGEDHFYLNRWENQGAQILGEEIYFWDLSVYNKGQFYSNTCRSNEATKFSQEDNVDIVLNFLYSKWSKSGIIDSFVRNEHEIT